jgi:hypothetical protein
MYPPSKSCATIALSVFILWPCLADAGEASTSTIRGTSTSSSPITTTIHAKTQAAIRFEVAGAKLSTVGNKLSISISVDSSKLGVTSGIQADQIFRDSNIGAVFFGYYFSTGVKSVHQASKNIHVKLRKGNAETPGRTFYLAGNGTTSPHNQADLKIAPSTFTTFATAPSNSVHCGPQYMSNGLSNPKLNCAGGSTISNMDLTQFVKVLYNDPDGSYITSQLEFIATAE